MIKAVVFDMDGVLFDTERLCKECYCQIAKELHLPDMEKVFDTFIGRNVTDTKRMFEEHYIELVSFDQFDALASALAKRRKKEEGIPVKKGVRELLEFLKNKGLHIGLASSTRREKIMEMLEETGISEYFETVIAGDMVKHSKPDPEIYLLACEGLKVKPEEAYAIEDSFNGIRSANRAGMKPIMVPDLLSPDSEMRELSFCICDDLLEVLEEKSLWQV